MHTKLKEIKAIDFDLDGTLYLTTREINDRIRTKIAEKILEINSDFKNLSSARAYFEKEYASGKSGSRILQDAGYGDRSKEIRSWCLINADIIGLIKPNKELVNLLNELREKYELNLLTSSPKDLSLGKLEKLGIKADMFHQKIFNGYKSSGIDFHTLTYFSEFPAVEHVYVGDRKTSDIIPAKELNMKTIAVGSKIDEADFSVKEITKIRGLLL